MHGVLLIKLVNVFNLVGGHSCYALQLFRLWFPWLLVVFFMRARINISATVQY